MGELHSSTAEDIRRHLRQITKSEAEQVEGYVLTVADSSQDVLQLSRLSTEDATFLSIDDGSGKFVSTDVGGNNVDVVEVNKKHVSLASTDLVEGGLDHVCGAVNNTDRRNNSCLTANSEYLLLLLHLGNIEENVLVGIPIERDHKTGSIPDRFRVGTGCVEDSILQPRIIND